MTPEIKRRLIDPSHPELPVIRQCELLDLNRATYYYKSRRDEAFNEHLMRLIDQQYTRAPSYGVPRMTAWLNRQGYPVNHKRVARLMRRMAITAVYPKRRTSIPDKEHEVFPYLLRGLAIERPNQVWCTDITYIRMVKGFIYLVAVMDWFSRYVLSWEMSNTLDAGFCMDALNRALLKAKPEIFNSDQGSQFTSKAFLKILKDREIAISMDGRGRVFDNIFIERLWRTIKYEEVYLHDYRSPREARQGIGGFLEFYNRERLHSSLGYGTPEEAYAGLLKAKEELPIICGGRPPRPRDLSLSGPPG